MLYVVKMITITQTPAPAQTQRLAVALGLRVAWAGAGATLDYCREAPIPGTVKYDMHCACFVSAVRTVVVDAGAESAAKGEGKTSFLEISEAPMLNRLRKLLNIVSRRD